MNWVLYLSQFAFLALVLWLIADRLIDKFRKPVKQTPKIAPVAGSSGRRMTPPPEPIDRTAFLQARIAYLAHMRDEEIEVNEAKPTEEPRMRVRKMTKKEMIEAVNLQDEDHVDALLSTWDQVQRKQREKSL